MTWLKAVFEFITALVLKLVTPVLAWLGGKGYAEKKEAQRDSAKERLRADRLAEAHRISDGVDIMPDDDLERLREKLNDRS